MTVTPQASYCVLGDYLQVKNKTILKLHISFKDSLKDNR